MASITQMRAGIATRSATIAGLNAYPKAPGQVNVPAAIVLPRRVNYDSTMARGSDDFVFIIQLLVSKALDDVGQDLLDKYLAGSGPESIKEAVDGDLDGLVDFAHVVSVDNYGMVEWNGVQYLGAEVTVNVTAEGTV